MKLEITIDNVALMTLVFAVVAITTVSTVAMYSAERLITTNEQVLRAQRVIASLEAIRYQALLIENGEQSYVISGKEADLASYRTGVVEIEAEINYLADKRADYPLLDTGFAQLKSAAASLVRKEKRLIVARKNQGFLAAQAMSKLPDDDVEHEKVLALTADILGETRGHLNQLQVEQFAYGDKVRRLILALITSSALILIILYGTLRRLNLEQHHAQVRMAHIASHDALTGLFNRSAVVEFLEQKIKDTDTAALGGFMLLLLDLDGFKDVNDTLGHAAGDDLLKQVATRISLAMRDSDYVARLGGDEFIVVLPQLSETDNAQCVTTKLTETISKPYQLGEHSANITVSIGASQFPQDGRNRETMMKNADLALYEAKRGGRNQTRFFTPGNPAK